MTSDTGTAAAPVFRVFSKGTAAEGDDVRRSMNWVVARRGWLRVFPDRLEMGDWRIPFTTIQEATLFRLKGLIGGYVLRVVAGGRSFQFGMNPWALMGKEFPFPHRREDTRVGHTALSIALRVFLVAALLAWAIEKL